MLPKSQNLLWKLHSSPLMKHSCVRLLQWIPTRLYQDQCCTNSGISLSRNESSRSEKPGLVPSFARIGSAESQKSAADVGCMISETDSVISSTRSTITPLMPIRCCRYTASGTLLQQWHMLSISKDKYDRNKEIVIELQKNTRYLHAFERLTHKEY